MAECCKHSKCSKSASARLPKRVLEFNELGSGCRLIEPWPDFSTPYVALSYCWGGTQPLQTTSHNLEDYKKEIPWNALPVVYQNAAEVILRLGVRYLWIDALCIVQDDRADWDEEACKMADVYRYAHFTIVVASSPDPYTPFLVPRDPIWDTTVREFRERDGSTSLLYTRRRQKKNSIAKDVSGRYWDGAIHERAWAFQEELLSTRAIHYTNARVIWDCNTVCKFEDCDALIADSQSQEACHNRDEIHTHETTFALNTKWQKYVKAYSRRLLSYPSDRLPALSGVARTCATESGDGYLAGLWRESLLLDLCWGTMPGGPEFQRLPCGYVAPSWSWASLPAGIEVHYLSSKPYTRAYASVVDANVALKGSNEFGEVSDAYITLRSLVLEVMVANLDQDTPRKDTSYVKACHPEIDVSTHFTTDIEVSPGWGLLATGETEATLCRGASARGRTDDAAKLYIVLLHADKRGRPVGLVLGRSPKVAGAFERVAFKLWMEPEWLRVASEMTVTIV